MKKEKKIIVRSTTTKNKGVMKILWDFIMKFNMIVNKA